MATSTDLVYKSRDEIINDVVAAWQARFPNIVLTEDSITRLWTEVFAEVAEQLFLQAQLTHDDMFIQTANSLALVRYGEERGRPQKGGTLATGSVRFEGSGGTYIPVSTQVGASRPSLDDELLYETTTDATIPNPGIPDPPVASEGVAGALTGTYEYVVTFLTADGETLPSIASNALSVAAKKISLASIPLGGTGTTGRRIYRRLNGGVWGLLDEIDDNTTTTYLDNGATGPTLPPSVSTAERIMVDCQSTDVGIDYNADIGTVIDLVGDPGSGVVPGISNVINTAAFTGGSDPEDIETFRQKLLEWVRTPKSGGTDDLIAWATSVDGCESASVTKNVDHTGAPALGTVTVRISGPGGIVPDSGVVDAVTAELESHDLANITIDVTTFTPENVDVTVTITPIAGFSTGDLTASVQDAIANYINALPPGATVYKVGILAAVINLLTVENVTSTFTDTTMTDTEKAVAHTITVS